MAVPDGDRERAVALRAERPLRGGQRVLRASDRQPRHEHAAAVEFAEPPAIGLERLDGGRQQHPLERRAVLRRGLLLADPPVGSLQPAGLAAQVRGARVECPRRAPEGALDRELALDPRAALARDQPEQRAGRDREQVRVGLDLARQHGEIADRRERGVDQGDEREHREQLARRDARAEPLAQGRGAEVEADLRREREHEDAEGRAERVVARERRDHQRGADRVPAVGHDHEQPLGVGSPAEQFRQLAEDRPERHERRDRRGGGEEQHRHEHELGRADQAGAELEAHAPHQRVTQGQEHRRRDVVVVRGDDRHRQGGHDEQRGGDELHRSARVDPAVASARARVVRAALRRPRPPLPEPLGASSVPRPCREVSACRKPVSPVRFHHETTHRA